MRTCDGALAKLKEGEAGNGAVYRSVGKAFVLSSRSAEQTRMGELKEKYAADVSSLKTRNAKLRTSATQLQTQLQEIVKELQAQPASA
jgi:chaperonin cofactor prefoldin